jgi:hypothetical protein
MPSDKRMDLYDRILMANWKVYGTLQSTDGITLTLVKDPHYQPGPGAESFEVFGPTEEDAMQRAIDEIERRATEGANQ